MPDENVLLSFMTMQVSDSGRVSFIVAAAVSVFIIALAWQVVRR